MKILLIGFTKLKYMPYSHFYLDNIDCKKNEVHLLYWNRDEQPEDTASFPDVTLHEFRMYQEDDVPKSEKIGGFIRYRQFTKTVLRTDFDLVIVMHTLPAVLIAETLLGKYRNRFILDYRDSTYEWFAPFRSLIQALQRASLHTFVSSDGFRVFFPEKSQADIMTSFNFLQDALAHRDYPKTESPKIRIGQWGFLRDTEINMALVDQIGKDERFSLHYYGREQNTSRLLKEYVESKGYRNIHFHGEYCPDDRYTFAQGTDLIHNLYDDRNMQLAMSNKYYDGIFFRIPQLAAPGVMGQKLEEKGIGFVCSPYEPDFCDRVYTYYHNLCLPEFQENCDRDVNQVLEAYAASAAAIRACTGGL